MTKLSGSPQPDRTPQLTRRTVLGGLGGATVLAVLPGAPAAATGQPATTPLAQTTVGLDDTWRFATDPDRIGHGQAEQWFSDTYDDSGWPTIQSGSSWESQGVSFAGYAWYRQRFTLPGELAGVPLTLLLANIYSDDDVWLNGVRVAGLAGEYKYDNHRSRAYPVPTSRVRYGEANTLAVRVWGGNIGFEGRNSGLVAGAYQAVLDPYRLMARRSGGTHTAELPVELWDLGPAQQGEAFELVFRFEPTVLDGGPAELEYTLTDFYGAPIGAGTTPVALDVDGIAKGVVAVDAATSQLVYLAGRFKADVTVVDAATGATRFADALDVDHLHLGGYDVILPELPDTFEETPYGTLKLVDVIDCSTGLDQEPHPYLQSSYTESGQRFETPGSRVTVSVNTILGRAARESDYGWFAYRVGRGRLTVGNTYLVRIEYPEDKPLGRRSARAGPATASARRASGSTS